MDRAGFWIRTCIAPVLFMSLAPGQVTAQHQHAASGADVIAPGDTRIDATRLATGEWTMRYLRVKDGQERQIGMLHYSLAAVEGEAGTLRLVMRFENTGVTSVDTTIFASPRMEPITHRGHAAVRRMSLNFDGTRVTGRIEPASGEAETVDATLAMPVFDSALMEQLVGALPLAPGLHARLPMYVHERGGLVWLSVHVTGRAEDGQWQVDADLAGQAARLLVDPTTRRLSTVIASMPDGSEMRAVR